MGMKIKIKYFNDKIKKLEYIDKKRNGEETWKAQEIF